MADKTSPPVLFLNFKNVQAIIEWLTPTMNFRITFPIQKQTKQNTPNTNTTNNLIFIEKLVKYRDGCTEN